MPKRYFVLKGEMIKIPDKDMLTDKQERKKHKRMSRMRPGVEIWKVGGELQYENRVAFKIPWYDFVQCRSRKFISLVSCDFIEKQDSGQSDETIVVRVPQHISLHSSIVEVDYFNDHFIDFVNRVRDKRKKYELFQREPNYTLWFKNIDDASLADRNEYTICLLLEWDLDTDPDTFER